MPPATRPRLTLVPAPAPSSAVPRLVLYRGAWAVYFKRQRISTGAGSRAEAENFLADFIRGLDRPAPLAADTTTAMLAAYLANRQERNKPGAERMSWSHKQLRRLLGALDPRHLGEPDFNAYAKKRLDEGVGDATIRTELSALRAALRWRLGAAAAPKVDMPEKPDARDRWLTEDECARLLGAAERPHIAMFIQLGLHTAARSHAMLDLTWDRVDLDQRRIDYRIPGATRSRKRRVPVPINDDLLPVLLAAKERATTPFVIEWAGGQVKSVKHGLANTARRAGLADVTPHVLRHTAATRMLQRGVDIWQVAGMLGHSDTRQVQETYGHHHPDYLKSAADALRNSAPLCP